MHMLRLRRPYVTGAFFMPLREAVGTNLFLPFYLNLRIIPYFCDTVHKTRNINIKWISNSITAAAA